MSNGSQRPFHEHIQDIRLVETRDRRHGGTRIATSNTSQDPHPCSDRLYTLDSIQFRSSNANILAREIVDLAPGITKHLRRILVRVQLEISR